MEVFTSEQRKILAKMILMERKLVRVGGVCDLCGDEEKTSIQENILVLTFSHNDGDKAELRLCNFHEGLLLAKLLKSYLKRRSCKKLDNKMGFIGDLPKEMKDDSWEKEDKALTLAVEALG